MCSKNSVVISGTYSLDFSKKIETFLVSKNKEEELRIGKCNSFVRKLVFQVGIWTEKLSTHHSDGNFYIEIIFHLDCSREVRHRKFHSSYETD